MLKLIVQITKERMFDNVQKPIYNDKKEILGLARDVQYFQNI